ncbi:MaoC family dehydratase [Nocardia rhizosphaerihabitans]|uniref:MaoC family dehydratase n=1 Tax=Nocardia rhizosphaerihabitans TaxID=1691570 RepID=UPI0036719635
MRTFRGIAELEAAVGSHLGYSEWHTITQSQINAFADATSDRQWIHIDTEKAANGPFGTTIAHGYLTLSLVPLLVAQVYRVEGVQMAVNYGSNKLRFPAPVPVDSTVRAGVELVSVAAGAAGHLVTAKVVIEREGGDKPVCVVESLSLVVA